MRLLLRFCVLAVLTLLASPSRAQKLAAGPFADSNAAQAVARQAGRQAGSLPAQLLRYRALTLDVAALQATLAAAPLARAAAPAPVLTLPLPDGRSGRFRIVEAPIMDAALAARLPQLKTYAGIGLDDPTATLRFDFSPDRGFHGQILSGNSGTVLIDPVASAGGPLQAYLSFHPRDMAPGARPALNCLPGEEVAPVPPRRRITGPDATIFTYDYRLCIAATGEYTQAVGGTGTPAQQVLATQAAIVTSMTRVDGIYRRELAVSFTLIDNTSVVFTDPATDPYNNADRTDLINQNQAVLDNAIGAGSYDVGHVFSTFGGGLAEIRGACRPGGKGRGTSGTSTGTGYGHDLIVCHELGHQFGAKHTFAGSAGSCNAANRNAATAWEAGSGSTIMAYPGTCAADDVQSYRDQQFHTGSFEQMLDFIVGATCSAAAPHTQAIPLITGPPTGKYIPANTPFRLTGAVTGLPASAPLTYSWEEVDLGASRALNSTQFYGQTAPLFRSYADTTSPTRYFPRLTNLAAGTQRPGEELPTVTRALRFRCTARTFRLLPSGVQGCVAYSPVVDVNVTAGVAPFVVTQPSGGQVWAAGSTQAVQWNVGTTSWAPVSCLTVNVRLSADGGATYPYLVAQGVPNNGGATFVVPGVNSTRVRLMVEAADNLFFNVSPANITVTGPTISGFAPAQGPVGTTVVLTGTGFLTATALKLNGAPVASFVIDSDTQITAVLPSQPLTQTGRLSVTNPLGTASSETDFRIEVKVLGVAPPAHQPNAAAGVSPGITYTQPPAGASLGGIRVFGNQRQGRRSGSLAGSSGATVAFTPTHAFRPGELVSVTATSAVTNQGGDAADPYVWQFRAATGGSGGGRFGPPLTYSYSEGPGDTRLADLNNDGNLDLLTTVEVLNLVNVRLGDGQGHFVAPGTNVDLFAQPVGIEVADVDGDGDLDLLAVSYFSPSKLIVRYNNGSGVFTGAHVLPVPFGPLRLAVGDVDRDGDLDVAVNSDTQGGSVISICRNNGSGLFSIYGSVPVNMAPADLALGDLDNDGDLDLITADFVGINQVSSVVSIRNNDGRGVFGGTVAVPVNAGPNRLLLGDFDHDGDLDGLTNSTAGNANTRTLTLLRNNGTGQLFAEPQPGTGGEELEVGDLDADGDLDVLALSASGLLRPYLNNGTGQFAAGPPWQQLSTGNGAQGLSLGDLDNDGDLDAVGAQRLAYQINVSLNQAVPAISGFAPASGPVGTVVVINGRGFTGATGVRFHATWATAFTVDSDTQITATVPAGAGTGLIVVAVPGPGGGELISSAQAFQVLVPSVLPTITSFTPTSGPVGTVVTLTGTNLDNVTSVAFGNGYASAITLISATQMTATVGPASTTGLITAYAPAGQGSSATSFTIPPPPVPANDLCTAPNLPVLACGQTLTGTTLGSTSTGDPMSDCGGTRISPAAGGVFYRFLGNGQNVTLSLCGANFDTQLLVYTGTCSFLSCDASNDDSCGLASELTFAAFNNVTYYIFVTGYGSARGDFTLSATCQPLPNLVVSSPQNISGVYNNVTVTSTGVAVLTSSLTVTGAMEVQAGGHLDTNCRLIMGYGSFSLAAGATLSICAPQGITTNGGGAISVMGSRTFSPDAHYRYTGTTQQTGNGLPAQVRNLTIDGQGTATQLTLTQHVSIKEVLRLTHGDLHPAGYSVTLLSDAATGTALIDNSGGAVVADGTYSTMERAISGSLNPGMGYRHLSSPMSESRIGWLSTPGYAPVVNSAYNTSPTPLLVQPFPNIFGYDESRIASAQNNLTGFHRGWISPDQLNTTLDVGRGYTVQLPATAKPRFTGIFTTGNVTLPLTRGSHAEAGWALVGNPYPSPIDWSVPSGIVRNQVDNAMYVFESTSQYGGQYRAYVNGVGTSPLIAAGQGFFVRVSNTFSSGSLTFTNAARLTEFNGQPALYRSGADPRPRLELTLGAAGGPADATHLYFEAGATAGADAAYDAHKLPNPELLSFWSETATGQALAINGLPPLETQDVVVPLGGSVPRTGSYTLLVAGLHNFGTTAIWLRDAQTGTFLRLLPGLQTMLALPAGMLPPGRLALVFRPAQVTAIGTGLSADLVSVYPNPTAGGSCTVLLPPLPVAAACFTLRNALGQQVSRQVQALSATVATQARFPVAGLAPGLYLLSIDLGRAGIVTKRLLIE